MPGAAGAAATKGAGSGNAAGWVREHTEGGGGGGSKGRARGAWSEVTLNYGKKSGLADYWTASRALHYQAVTLVPRQARHTIYTLYETRKRACIPPQIYRNALKWEFPPNPKQKLG